MPSFLHNPFLLHHPVRSTHLPPLPLPPFFQVPAYQIEKRKAERKRRKEEEERKKESALVERDFLRHTFQTTVSGATMHKRHAVQLRGPSMDTPSLPPPPPSKPPPPRARVLWTLDGADDVREKIERRMIEYYSAHAEKLVVFDQKVRVL